MGPVAAWERRADAALSRAARPANATKQRPVEAKPAALGLLKTQNREQRQSQVRTHTMKTMTCFLQSHCSADKLDTLHTIFSFLKFPSSRIIFYTNNTQLCDSDVMTIPKHSIQVGMNVQWIKDIKTGVITSYTNEGIFSQKLDGSWWLLTANCISFH